MSNIKTFDEFLNENEEPSKFLTQAQIDWCNNHIKPKWKVNEKGEITVKGNVSFKNKNFDKFEVQFANISGNFDCKRCKNLTSLEGAPKEVGGTFDCAECEKLDPSYTELIKHEDLFKKWLANQIDVDEFFHKNRGRFKADRYGL